MTTVEHYDTDADAERDLFGEPAPPQLPPEEPPAAAPAPPRRRAPGPPPNPKSKRQMKLAAAAQRSRTAPAPPRKATPNKPAAKSEAAEVYRVGALAVIGWAAQPLAAAGLGMRVAAAATAKKNPAKAAVMAQHSMALTLDSLTLAVHEDGLADGLAAAAEQVPWMGQVLEKAARISPFAALTQTGIAIVFQVLCNHGIMPVSSALGTLGPGELAMAAGVPIPGLTVPMEEPPPVG